MKIPAMKILQLGTFNLGSFVSFTVFAVKKSHYLATKARGQVTTYLQVHVSSWMISSRVVESSDCQC
jgi:hypothetical protein